MPLTDLAVDELRRSLLEWYDRVARDLPWRATDDPYAVLVCEVMSQQTRVETVKRYWAKWIAAFPTAAALAAAPEDDVMTQWAGLGYYRRARNLHRAAKIITAEHGGELPDDLDGLRALPGIGAYTAGAVASIAFGRSVAAVDGNVSRVVSRLELIGTDPTRAAFKNAVREVASALVPTERPGDFNQAMMELGATICTPKNPRCNDCPIAPRCEAYACAATDRYPPTKQAAPPRLETRVTLVPMFADQTEQGDHGEQVFVRKRPEEGLLAGTWEFPTYAVDDEAQAAATLRTQHDLQGELQRVGEVVHVFSHIRMTYEVFSLQVAERLCEGGRWIPPDELHEIAMSTAMLRVAAVVPELTDTSDRRATGARSRSG